MNPVDREIVDGGTRWLADLWVVVFAGITFIIGGCANMKALESHPGPSIEASRKPELPQIATEQQPEQPPKPAVERISFAADVPFDVDKFDLRPDARARLDGFVSNLKNLTLNSVVVVGHTDLTGSAAYNQRLSERRAESVKSYLISIGIEPNRIYWEGKGAKEPVPTDQTPQGRAKNNRVEIKVIATRLQVQVVPILFATNRARTKRNIPDDYFGDEETADRSGDRLTLGRALVGVPLSHLKGNVEQPGWVRITLEKVSLGMFTALNPSIHFSFVHPIEELTDDDFQSELQQTLGASKSQAALLYVHGFANSFADAAYRTAQLSFDLRAEGLDVIPLMFSWPSDADHVNYISAKDRVRSAARQLAIFLNKIVGMAGVGKVHVIAHSMGAEVLGTAFAGLGKPNLVAINQDGQYRAKFNQIILAAPDIRAVDFGSIILPAIESGHRVTNYASSNDKALRLSKHANAEPRAGDSGAGLMEVNGIETIDASAVNSEFLGHSFFAESLPMIRDLKALVGIGAKPEERGLMPVRRNTWTYWLFPR